MTKFAYNNIKNTSTGYILFELNYGYHFKILLEENVNPYLKSHFTYKLAKKLRNLIKICC